MSDYEGVGPLPSIAPASIAPKYINKVTMTMQTLITRLAIPAVSAVALLLATSGSAEAQCSPCGHSCNPCQTQVTYYGPIIWNPFTWGACYSPCASPCGSAYSPSSCSPCTPSVCGPTRTYFRPSCSPCGSACSLGDLCGLSGCGVGGCRTPCRGPACGVPVAPVLPQSTIPETFPEEADTTPRTFSDDPSTMPQHRHDGALRQMHKTERVKSKPLNRPKQTPQAGDSVATRTAPSLRSRPNQTQPIGPARTVNQNMARQKHNGNQGWVPVVAPSKLAKN